MRTSDVTCPGGGAGFYRLELWSEPGQKGKYHCPSCNSTLEAFDETKRIVNGYRSSRLSERFRVRQTAAFTQLAEATDTLRRRLDES
ncbi:putative metal-binding protein [Bradyrhizobium sp. RT9b]